MGGTIGYVTYGLPIFGPSQYFGGQIQKKKEERKSGTGRIEWIARVV